MPSHDTSTRTRRRPEASSNATFPQRVLPLSIGERPATAAQFRALQRAAGNSAVSRLFASRSHPHHAPHRLHRVPRERPEQIEARQPWSSYQIAAPLGPVDDTIAAAVRANAALGFTGDKISLLLVALGLPRRPTVLERRFVEALRRFLAPQGPAAEGAETQAEPGTATSGTGAEAMALTQGASAPGVLDEATLYRLDIGGTWGVGEHGAAARRFYRSQAPWHGMPSEQFQAVRAAILAPLHVSEEDIQLTEGRVAVTDHFIAQAINWQMWNRRSEGATGWGKLGLSSLASLGAPVQAPEPAETAAAAETVAATGPTVSVAAAGGETAPAEPEPGEQEEPRDEQGLTAPQRTRLQELVAEIDAYLRRWYARVAGEPAEVRSARQTELDRPMETRIAAMRTEIEGMGLPYTDFSSIFQIPRIRVRVEYVRREMRVLLGLEARPVAPTGEQAGAAATEPSPLERHSLQEATAALSEREYVVQQAALVREGWDPRVWSGPGTVQQAAVRAIAGLTALRVQLDTLRAIVSAAVDRPAQLPVALSNIHSATFLEVATLRRPFTPSLPERVNPAEMGEWSDARKQQYAVLWRNRLRDAVTTVDGEIRRHQGYNRSEMIAGNALAVQVDLHRSGITITNNNGRPLRADEMHLDPIFAEAMVRFLEQLAGLGVTEMWTAGFLRNAISSADTHPRGQACDITGFRISDQLLHLRSGRPQAPPAATGDEDYESTRRGHSDWYDHAGTVGGMTHERVLHAITNMMRTYFSRIVGPGHNAEHQGHWHIELSQSSTRGPQVLAVAQDVDQPTFVTDRADTREEGWRTPGE